MFSRLFTLLQIRIRKYPIRAVKLAEPIWYRDLKDRLANAPNGAQSRIVLEYLVCEYELIEALASYRHQ